MPLSSSSKISRDRPLKQTAIKNYVKRFDPLTSQSTMRSKMQPKQQQQQNFPQKLPQARKAQPEFKRKSLDPNIKKGVLNGVIAFVDVWTDDDTNVSECCEKILQDLGAMVRKSYTDTITHLVFKNGSPTTFNKAKTKGKHIVNLLWVTHCQEKNKKVPEEEYKVTIAPQKLIGNKRRKSSMEPGRVKALFGHESSLSDNIASDNEEVRRRTIVTTDWVAKSLESNKRAISREREIRKRYIEELEKEEESAKKEDPLAKLDKPSLPPRLSLPICAETIANRHTTKKRKSNMNEIIPVEPPSKEAQEQIKARFSIGDKNTKNNITDTNDNSNNDSTITIPSSSSSSSHSHNNNSSSNSKNPLVTSNNSSLSNSKNDSNNNNNNNSIIPVELPQIPQINNNSIRRRKLKVYTQSPSSTDTVKQPLALKVSIDRTSNTSSKNVK